MITSSFPALIRPAVLSTIVITLAGCRTDTGPADVGADPTPQNRLPIVNAGADISVGEGQPVTLAGIASDPDGDTISLEWTQLSGTTVQLAGGATANATFSAPSADADMTLEFRLAVSDSEGGSASDDVVVYILNDDPPTADAGEDQRVSEGTLVVLDGTASSDTDGNINVFSWSQISGAPVRLDNSSSLWPTFVTPAISRTARLEFELVVADEGGNTDKDTVTITVDPRVVGPIPDDPDQFLAFLNRSSVLYRETQATADAYYAAIDPRREKTTLGAWKSANGFDQGTDAQAVYRNAADLGFARVMSVRSNGDGSVAAYVENYETLEIAVAAVQSGNRDGLLATVAMEYSAHPDDPAGTRYTKFFAFDGGDDRVTKLDLDGRGAKFQPGLCLVCHGGRPKPLANGKYPDNGAVNAQFLPWDVDTFEFSDNPRFSREAQEDIFKILNRSALATYPDPAALTEGLWSGRPSRELIQGWYGDDSAGSLTDTFNEEFVPIGWRKPENGGPAGNPADVEQLYLRVIGPNCRACHSQRGRIYAFRREGELIDFSSYAKFNEYRSRTIDLVFDQGNMPNAKVTYDNFWSEKDGVVAAEVLANHFGIDATDRRPGRPVANPGPPREAPTGIIKLNGEASLFADSFAWSFAQSDGKPGNSDAVIVNANSARPLLRTDVAGVYRVQLVVGDGETDSEPAIATIAAFDGFAERSFASDIAPIFSADCQSCHSAGLSTSIEGIGVLFDDPFDLYDNVVSYVNFADVAASPIVKKPTGKQHGAGATPRAGFDLAGGFANKDNYDKLIQWISEGAQNN